MMNHGRLGMLNLFTNTLVKINSMAVPSKNNSHLVSTVLLVAVFAVIFVLLVTQTMQNSNQTNHTTATNPTSSVQSIGSTTTADDIQVTDGRRHSVPLDEIISGGPGKDGIPSIDDPQFESLSEARSWLPSSARGIGVNLEGEARFYPYSILVWHEVVNDQVADQPMLVTYCPLCKTGIVFDPTIDGTRFEFGVSGKLWQSNLLMYNRTDNPDNESYFSQVLGEGVVGPLTGTKLEILPSTITTLDKWQGDHPNTNVLARPENSRRNYNRDPYSGYYESGRVSFGAEFEDQRLDPKALVYGIEVGDRFKAYPADNLPQGTTTDQIGTTTVVINRNQADTVTFKSGEERISHVTGFWFSWAAVHPETDIYQDN